MLNIKRLTAVFLSTTLLVSLVFGGFANAAMTETANPSQGQDGFVALMQYIQPTADPDIYKVMLALESPTPPKPADVVLVLDATESMNEQMDGGLQRWAGAIAGARAAVDVFTDPSKNPAAKITRVGVVVFGAENEYDQVVFLTDDKQDIMDGIDKIEYAVDPAARPTIGGTTLIPGGGNSTDLYGGVLSADQQFNGTGVNSGIAVNAVNKPTEAGTNKYVIFLSDGTNNPTSPRKALSLATKMKVDDKVTFMTIGLDVGPTAEWGVDANGNYESGLLAAYKSNYANWNVKDPADPQATVKKAMNDPLITGQNTNFTKYASFSPILDYNDDNVVTAAADGVTGSVKAFLDPKWTVSILGASLPTAAFLIDQGSIISDEVFANTIAIGTASSSVDKFYNYDINGDYNKFLSASSSIFEANPSDKAAINNWIRTKGSGGYQYQPMLLMRKSIKGGLVGAAENSTFATNPLFTTSTGNTSNTILGVSASQWAKYFRTLPLNEIASDDYYKPENGYLDIPGDQYWGLPKVLTGANRLAVASTDGPNVLIYMANFLDKQGMKDLGIDMSAVSGGDYIEDDPVYSGVYASESAAMPYVSPLTWNFIEDTWDAKQYGRKTYQITKSRFNPNGDFYKTLGATKQEGIYYPQVLDMGTVGEQVSVVPDSGLNGTLYPGSLPTYFNPGGLNDQNSAATNKYQYQAYTLGNDSANMIMGLYTPNALAHPYGYLDTIGRVGTISGITAPSDSTKLRSTSFWNSITRDQTLAGILAISGNSAEFPGWKIDTTVAPNSSLGIPVSNPGYVLPNESSATPANATNNTEGPYEKSAGALYNANTIKRKSNGDIIMPYFRPVRTANEINDAFVDFANSIIRFGQDVVVKADFDAGNWEILDKYEGLNTWYNLTGIEGQTVSKTGNSIQWNPVAIPMNSRNTLSFYIRFKGDKSNPDLYFDFLKNLYISYIDDYDPDALSDRVKYFPQVAVNPYTKSTKESENTVHMNSVNPDKGSTISADGSIIKDMNGAVSLSNGSSNNSSTGIGAITPALQPYTASIPNAAANKKNAKKKTAQATTLETIDETATKKEKGKTIAMNVSKVPVYDAPDKNGKVVLYLAKGKEFKISGVTNNYYMIQYKKKDGKVYKGYVLKKDVKVGTKK